MEITFVLVTAVLTSIMGTIMSLANFLQTYKIVKNKSSDDVALTMFIIILVGMLCWFLYGIAINSFPLIFTNIIGMTATISVIAVWFVFRTKVREKVKHHVKQVKSKITPKSKASKRKRGR